MKVSLHFEDVSRDVQRYDDNFRAPSKLEDISRDTRANTNSPRAEMMTPVRAWLKPTQLNIKKTWTWGTWSQSGHTLVCNIHFLPKASKKAILCPSHHQETPRSVRRGSTQG